MYCKYCGKELERAASSCPYCRKAVSYESDNSSWIEEMRNIAGISSPRPVPVPVPKPEPEDETKSEPEDETKPEAEAKPAAHEKLWQILAIALGCICCILFVMTLIYGILYGVAKKDCEREQEKNARIEQGYSEDKRLLNDKIDILIEKNKESEKKPDRAELCAMLISSFSQEKKEGKREQFNATVDSFMSTLEGLKFPDEEDRDAEEKELPEVPQNNGGPVSPENKEPGADNKPAPENKEPGADNKPAPENKEPESDNKPAPENKEPGADNKPAPENNESGADNKPAPENNESGADNKPAPENTEAEGNE